ncbi:hypothetical protein JZ751_021809 [Albula glossodonta]|uniref:Uncharacterized protein n=1 Tax=Albula glossodonta TaxID=121402 RepID=A0A8T2MR71_9TELE|nr:hypothetical protein JZ751_021809 [Albula glossodonta]
MAFIYLQCHQGNSATYVQSPVSRRVALALALQLDQRLAKARFLGSALVKSYDRATSSIADIDFDDGRIGLAVPIFDSSPPFLNSFPPLLSSTYFRDISGPEEELELKQQRPHKQAGSPESTQQGAMAMRPTNFGRLTLYRIPGTSDHSRQRRGRGSSPDLRAPRYRKLSLTEFFFQRYSSPATASSIWSLGDGQPGLRIVARFSRCPPAIRILKSRSSGVHAASQKTHTHAFAALTTLDIPSPQLHHRVTGSNHSH